jgi:hypothetical protein
MMRSSRIDTAVVVLGEGMLSQGESQRNEKMAQKNEKRFEMMQ